MDRRFWAKVQRAGDDECWEWTAARNPSGYGVFWYCYKRPAHRVSYFLTHDAWPECVLHSCDNRGCVNPRHLRAGAQLDNVRDREERGRTNTPKGEQHGRAVLTEGDVADIRRLRRAGHTYLNIAYLMGVSKATVADIVKGRTWRQAVAA